MLADLPARGSACDAEVVEAGYAEHGVVDAVAFQPAVAEDLPALHPGEGVLDAGPHLAVRGVVFLFPGRKFGLAGFTAVRDDQASAPVATVGNHDGPADGVLRTGQLPCLAVVAVPRDRPADGDDKAGVSVDDDLVVGGVPVVLRLLRDRVVTGGRASNGPRWAMIRSAADFETPNSGASCRRVRFVRQ